EELQLNQHVDGITGATLSVRALNKLARIALYLHQQSAEPTTP
ncbi:FMN-binding protein, partial [Paraglaciecola sp.]